MIWRQGGGLSSRLDRPGVELHFAQISREVIEWRAGGAAENRRCTMLLNAHKVFYEKGSRANVLLGIRTLQFSASRLKAFASMDITVGRICGEAVIVHRLLYGAYHVKLHLAVSC
jgi:hypothetical protein